MGTVQPAHCIAGAGLEKSGTGTGLPPHWPDHLFKWNYRPEVY